MSSYVMIFLIALVPHKSVFQRNIKEYIDTLFCKLFSHTTNIVNSFVFRNTSSLKKNAWLKIFSLQTHYTCWASGVFPEALNLYLEVLKPSYSPGKRTSHKPEGGVLGLGLLLVDSQLCSFSAASLWMGRHRAWAERNVVSILKDRTATEEVVGISIGSKIPLSLEHKKYVNKL